MGRRRWGAGVRLFVGVVAAVAALGAFGAAGASAHPICEPLGVNIQGMGSSLQTVAQTTWTGREVPFGLPLGPIPHTALTPSTGYLRACAAHTPPPTVSYTATGAEAALSAFRFNGSGSINTAVDFIGTEEPPTASQITNAEAAAGGAKPVIVPVSQTSIAVIVHPPTGCTLSKITWADLNKVFGGNGIKKWSEFSTSSGGAACAKPITRVVREEGSGVSYQFKWYLSALEEQEGAEGLPCLTGGSLTRWKELTLIDAFTDTNRVWPQCTGGTSVVVTAGDNAEAKKVVNTEGAIGYASLPNAKAQGATTVSLQNGIVSGTPIYATPGTTSGNSANCGLTKYTVPALGRRPPPGTGTGIAVDWSQVFGGYPAIGGTYYPLCTLAFDIGWTDYTDPGYGHGVEVGEIVKDYLDRYVVPPTEGQADIAGKWYAEMPSNVQAAAEFAAEQLG
jgi:ABC-type phosphate transport system substrate-binding protein